MNDLLSNTFLITAPLMVLTAECTVTAIRRFYPESTAKVLWRWVRLLYGVSLILVPSIAGIVTVSIAWFGAGLLMSMAFSNLRVPSGRGRALGLTACAVALGLTGALPLVVSSRVLDVAA